MYPLGYPDYGVHISDGATLCYCGRKLVTPVSNQGGIHSCVAFTTSAALGSLYAVSNSFSNPYVCAPDLSKQQIVDCLQLDDKGFTYEKVYDYIVKNGLYKEEIYEYDGRCGLPCRCYFRQGLPKLSCMSYHILNERVEVLYALHQMPLTAGIFLYASFGLHCPKYKSLNQLMGVYSPQPGEEPLAENGVPRRHAILVTGYGIQDGLNYFSIKNSEGLEWGLNGYGKVRADLLHWFGVPRCPRIIS